VGAIDKVIRIDSRPRTHAARRHPSTYNTRVLSADPRHLRHAAGTRTALQAGPLPFNVAVAASASQGDGQEGRIESRDSCRDVYVRATSAMAAALTRELAVKFTAIPRGHPRPSKPIEDGPALWLKDIRSPQKLADAGRVGLATCISAKRRLTLSAASRSH